MLGRQQRKTRKRERQCFGCRGWAEYGSGADSGLDDDMGLEADAAADDSRFSGTHSSARYPSQPRIVDGLSVCFVLCVPCCSATPHKSESNLTFDTICRLHVNMQGQNFLGCDTDWAVRAAI